MSTPGTLEFDGLVFDGGEGTSPYGWFLADLPGWYDGPPSKSSPEPRPQAHGSFGVARNYRAAKVVSVEGSFAGESMADAEAARERLAALQADGLPSDFRYTEPTLGSRTLTDAVLVNGPTLPARLYSPFFQFAFDVLATDPKKYGDEVVVSTGLPAPGGGLTWPLTWPLTWAGGGSSGRVTVTNVGRADTTSILEVTGGLDGGFSLTEVGTGREIRFQRAIPLDSTVSIDTRTGRAWIDAPGNDVSAFVTVSDWWPVPARGQSVIQFNAIGTPTGTPTLTARTAPAWW